MYRSVKIGFFMLLMLVFHLPVVSQPRYLTNVPSINSKIWFPESPGKNDLQSFEKELEHFTQRLKSKRSRYGELNFVRWVYYKVHRKYLKQYRTPATLLELHQERVYDCLTGTALYAMVLERLDIPYAIKETTYHVYLTLEVEGHTVIIESTSPLEGFITDPVLVKQTIDRYQMETGSGSSNGPDFYKPSKTVNNQISLTQLAGLQYYNQAVAAFNNKDLRAAYDQMSIALYYYPSDRLKEMMVFLLDTISSNQGMDPLLVQQALSRYGYLRQVPIAANSAR